MSNIYDSTCEICGHGFDIDDVCQVTYTDLSTKVFCYSCISPETENADNVVMFENWVCQCQTLLLELSHQRKENYEPHLLRDL